VFSTVDSGLTNLIHDRTVVVVLCSHSRLRAVVRVYFTLGRSSVEANSVVVGSMCPLKREQARRERESELRLVNSL